MLNNSRLIFFVFCGTLMTLTGFSKIINLEMVPSESLSYNVGHYCGIYMRAFVGIILVCRGFQIIR